MIAQKTGWIFCIIFATCFEVSNFFWTSRPIGLFLQPMSVFCQNE